MIAILRMGLRRYRVKRLGRRIKIARLSMGLRRHRRMIVSSLGGHNRIAGLRTMRIGLRRHKLMRMRQGVWRRWRYGLPQWLTLVVPIPSNCRGVPTGPQVFDALRIVV
jgi:hypothetical protein